jgi:septation ring formation regulator EzrA
VTNFAKSAWDAMLGIGRAETVESRLENVTRELERRRSIAFTINPLQRGKFDKETDRLASDQSVLQSDARLLKQASDLQATQARLVEDYEKSLAANKKWAEAGLSDTQKLNKALSEYRQNLATIQQGRQAAGLPPISDAEIKAQEKAIRDSIIKPAEDGTKAYERLLQGITKTVAETEAEAAGVDKLTPIQKARLDIYSKLGSELANLTFWYFIFVISHRYII